MSVRIMSKIFELSDVGPTQRLILLALADHADDNGRCYPSIARLCERTGLKERSVQSNIKALVAAGLLRIDRNAGPKGCNVFHVTPAADAPPQEMHPASNAPTPRISCTPPPQQMHPNHHRTINEPSYTPLPPKGDVREKSTYTDEFENWWQAYPNKTGKGAAFKAFQKAKKRDGADRLFSALQRQLPSLEQAANRPEGNFCPHAATWLNQSRYDDEVSQPRGNLMSRIANGENPWTNASENVLPLSQPRLPRG